MDNNGAVSSEKLREWSIKDGLSCWLEKNYDGKWEKHFGTFDSIEWREGVVPPEESEYLLVKDTLEAQEFQKLNKFNIKVMMSSVMPSIDDRLDMLWDDIDQGKLNKEGTFYKSIKNIKNSFFN